ncbi:MAG: hypothetical protein U1D99_00095, partial [Candidatus Omnitrophota bacterium]|nr:hypothetical protein [Candidatus Omnitrophota bacterium]
SQELQGIHAKFEKWGLGLEQFKKVDVPESYATEKDKKKASRGTEKKAVLKPLFAIEAENDAHEFLSLKETLDFVREQAQKGMHIQRYKGLGEMNPQQLWETTMDPARRTLLKVTLEDAVEVDKTFTILMGDEVEPRREFIESNAHDVKNLDV